MDIQQIIKLELEQISQLVEMVEGLTKNVEALKIVFATHMKTHEKE